MCILAFLILGFTDLAIATPLRWQDRVAAVAAHQPRRLSGCRWPRTRQSCRNHDPGPVLFWGNPLGMEEEPSPPRMAQMEVVWLCTPRVALIFLQTPSRVSPQVWGAAWVAEGHHCDGVGGTKLPWRNGSGPAKPRWTMGLENPRQPHHELLGLGMIAAWEPHKSCGSVELGVSSDKQG